MRKNIALFILLALVSATADPGCVGIFRKSTQQIPVTSSPAGATVTVDGENLGATPLEITLDRTRKSQVIRIELPGYNPVEIRSKRKLSGGVVLGNFAIGTGVGLVVLGVWGLVHVFDPLEGKDFPKDSEVFLVWGLSAAAYGAVANLVDAGSGRGYSIRPAELTVTLTKASGTPRVDTLLVDADELRNIKWIRVHKE